MLSYEVRVDDGALGSFTNFGASLSASTFTSTVTGLMYSSEYRFVVVASNHIGSCESNVVTAVVASLPSTPAIAPSLNFKFTTETSIRVVVNEVTADGGSPITNYQLQRTDASGSDFFDVTNEVKLDRQYQIDGLKKGLSYKFRYRVANKVGMSNWSPESVLIPAVEPTAPPKP